LFISDEVFSERRAESVHFEHNQNYQLKSEMSAQIRGEIGDVGIVFAGGGGVAARLWESGVYMEYLE